MFGYEQTPALDTDTLAGNRGGNMPLLQVVVALVIVGVVLWVINTYIPMSAGIKKILNLVVIVAVALYLLDLFGLLDTISRIRIGR